MRSRFGCIPVFYFNSIKENLAASIRLFGAGNNLG